MPINPWKLLKSKIQYENPWIKVEEHDVINPGGGMGIYGKVHFKNVAVGIVPVDDDGNTWLVGQYRYPLDEYSWEIPEGGCPIGERELDAAKRELREETGLFAASWEELLRIHTSNSVSDERGVVYLAKELKQGETDFEETEDLKIRKLPISEAFQMVMDGKITDSISIAALLKLKYLLDKI
ncbi:NUDIX hydrolase [Marivirga harenae]|uniref:NUDIX domain-containing protein n=1 Tax=Marivirga harenae TaxID=2010992 RepID=UPI0026DF3149|nr:NUDIX hydrolase [Marivirga harenae]WKV11959.1 NUDIX hydrolase [Marivirga harenae]|tara:strand:- start:54103 stop:54648 length:546 start_codon:yes stop_codon:yes gene_type:complete